MRNFISTKALLPLLLLLHLQFLFLYHVCSDTPVSSAPMEKAEQEALYMVIQGFVGEGWNVSGLYPDPCGWTMIQGVSCDLFDNFWYITDINIGPVLENSLECSPDAKFTPQLFELKHLKSLSIFNCFTSTSHQPTTISSQNWDKLAKNLETLEFRSNQGLNGEIPSIFGQLTNLNSLVLVDNALTGVIPQELSNLVHIKRLVLSGNQFSGSIPPSLTTNLTELLIMDLSRNSFTGALPASFGYLTSLIKLDLSHNILNGRLPNELGKLQNLTLLDLKDNLVSHGLPQSLQNLVSLQDLLLSNNPLGGDLVSFSWENLSNLTTLDLSNTGITGSIPGTIAGLRRLRYLALDNNHLTGNVPQKLASLPWLNTLYLNGNNLTGILEFPDDFYKRMGRRFASWNNTNLCYSTVETLSVGHAPYGVQQCKHEQHVNVLSSNPNVGDGDKDQNSSIMASLGFSSSFHEFWWVVLVQEVVVFTILILML
ncbi:piriformospora indica-insensitive protein 2-like [Dioscorea cayenensis subsp. rotundata]|uniref:Piriformospora indica-insensitive protein 2-like n=1 Tax=Dioscorea cayennensis subsp. rotundata TaxID=55577 RepID=A0AB40B926_DIOCR|nr:piriformospora indica-insensitive protein 2-like [Dioscorea cayenensis subsp. rotundata]